MSEVDQLERDLEHDRAHLRETLGALEDKMSPGRLLDEAMAHFNTGPKAFASDLTSQIRDNPMPALLTGVGLAWLMMSNGKASASGANGKAPDGKGYAAGLELDDYHAWQEHDRLQQAEWACVRLESETPEAHARRLDEARAAALGLGRDPQEDHEGFSSRVRHAADSVKQKGASARDKLKHAAGSAMHGVSSAAHHASDGLKSAASSTKGGVGSAVSSGLQLHESNPIATAAIGVAIGALFGAAIPLSRKEEEVLGDVADKGLAMGADLGRKATEAVSEKVNPSGGKEGGPDTGPMPAGSTMNL
ncbi:MAG: DUF3618 domain-containing protein [Brevundimonas sp.]|uniref:DUF3618 domain-containing protein n=1 Tax=Brevundimonas sp. TaxID=1871086 RepID=UPI003919A6E4